MLSLFDKILAEINPKMAHERLAWKQSIKMNYDAGRSDRLNSGWTVVNGTAESINKAQRDLIKARARDLERNSDVAGGIIGALERNVIGSGIKLQAKTGDENLNKQIEEAFKDWSKAKNCDISERQSFVEMQDMAIRRLIVDGAFIFLKVTDKKGNFRLQAKEVDELDSSKDRAKTKTQNAIIGGIEIDSYNKHIAYYFKDSLGNLSIIKADRVIYLNKIVRPSQIREVSNLSLVTKRVKELNDFIEAVGVKERVMACLSVFIKKDQPTRSHGRGSSVDSASGYFEKSIAPGMITELQPGDSVETVNPSGQASNAKEFICQNQRLAGAGQGLSYESTSRDMSQVNYSSARQGLLEDQKTYSKWQDFLIEHFCQEVFEEWLLNAVLTKRVVIKGFLKDPKPYLNHEWQRPGWSWIDPLKEAKANKEALDSNQTTLAQICSSGGRDWRDVLIQRSKEKELEKKLLGEEITKDV